MIRCTL